MQYMLIREVAEHKITVIGFWYNKSNQAPFLDQASWRQNKKIENKQTENNNKKMVQWKRKRNSSRLLYSSDWLYNKSDQNRLTFRRLSSPEKVQKIGINHSQVTNVTPTFNHWRCYPSSHLTLHWSTWWEKEKIQVRWLVPSGLKQHKKF